MNGIIVRLLIVVSLFAPGLALAGGAWLLWMPMKLANGTVVWMEVLPYETQDECMGMVFAERKTAPTAKDHYICLPVGVDPPGETVKSLKQKQTKPSQ